MPPARISLHPSPGLRELVKAAIGREATAIALEVKELEDRIAPANVPSPGGPVPIPYPNA